MNKTENLKNAGQKLWLDNIKRDYLLDGTLKKLIETYNISGLTSNPSIFEKAVSSSPAYAGALKLAAQKNSGPEEIMENLVCEDIQRACDILAPVHEASDGSDGYVSLEVSPLISDNFSLMLSEGARLFEKVGRKNLLIKIPATQAGIKAGEELLKKGAGINFTLIFSPENYKETAEAYLRAVKFRISKNLSTDIFSVASFFVSRIDTAVDKLLEDAESQEENTETKSAILALRGKTAIAECLETYKIYREIFFSGNFSALSEAGFKPQKLLWASTSVKNPSYSETLYMDELCLPDTINTAPENAIQAFAESGEINTEPFGERLKKNEPFFYALKEAGVMPEPALSELQKDGLKKFSDAYNSLLGLIEKKTEENLKAMENKKHYNEKTGLYAEKEMKELSEASFVSRLWGKDASLWKTEAEHVKIIKKSLGWLDSPYKMLSRMEEIRKFALAVKSEGFTDAVLLGMGGSSLAPEVMRSLFQKKGYPELHVLDTTNPDWILSVRKKLKIKTTLFIFSSKSGGTVEPNSQFKYFWAELKKAGAKNPGANFVAITDKGTSLEELALKKKFRKIFINPSDIGGRFSAISFFGLVPAAVCGADVKRIIEGAVAMADSCQNANIEKNPGVLLGAVLGRAYSLGRDKLTAIMPDKIRLFGLWIEQLVAESTGKENKGIIPVCEEEIASPEEYQDDRFFAVNDFANFISENREDKVKAVAAAGHPVFRIVIKEPYDIGAEFVRWEIATATAGFLMKINPFNQPNVQESKILTMELLDKVSKTGKLNFKKPDFDSEKVAIYISDTLDSIDKMKIKNYTDIFWEIFAALKEKEYFSIMAYTDSAPEIDNKLKALSALIRRYTASASFYSYGPRYLHSTGQLFKGGTDNGVFLILTSKPKKDIKIEGEKFSFAQLNMSQAVGDFKALEAKKRRVIMLQVKKRDLGTCLKYVINKMKEAGETKNSPRAEEEMPKVMEKKAPVKATKKIETNNTLEYVVIDYPKNLETITSRNYSVRIGSGDCVNMEISIDDQPWQNCRNSVGYWWYDWYNIQPGNHQLVARMNKGNNQYLISKRRRCKVS